MLQLRNFMVAQLFVLIWKQNEPEICWNMLKYYFYASSMNDQNHAQEHTDIQRHKPQRFR